MSQNQPHKEIIQGVEYTVYRLPVEESLRIFMRLTKIIAPSLGAMAGDGASDGKSFLDKKISAGMLSGAASELCSRIDEDEVMKIIEVMGEHSEADGVRLKKPHFSVHFSGRIGLLIKWLILCIRVQYADFLGDSGLA